MSLRALGEETTGLHGDSLIHAVFCALFMINLIFTNIIISARYTPINSRPLQSNYLHIYLQNSFFNMIIQKKALQKSILSYVIPELYEIPAEA